MQKKSEMSFYRRILVDAWRIAWEHKHLWVFGFFATIVGFGGVTEAIFSSSDRVYAFYPAVASGQSALQAVPGLTTVKAIISLSSYPALSLLVFVMIMALFVGVFAWMTYISIGALVSSAKKISRGGEPTFGDSVKVGAERFWPVLGVNVVTQLFIYCGLLLTSTTLAVLMIDHSVTSGVFYVGTFIVFTVLTVAASIAAVFATCGTVLHGEGVRAGLTSGWLTLVANWLVGLEMAVALFIASLAIGLASLLAGLVISVPLIFAMVVLAALKLQEATVAVLLVGSAIMLVIVVCVGSFITVFQTAAWTLLWSELNEKQRPLAKLHRLARKFGVRMG